MHLANLSTFLLAGLAAANAIPSVETAGVSDLALEKRQSTVWVDNCKPGSSPPGDYKAFDLGGCTAQLTFTKDRNHIAVQWEFEAVYADGARVKHVPFRNFDNFAVSDTFYSIDLGNNWLTSRAQSRQYTSVHEFTDICRNGQAPRNWYIRASAKDTACQPKGYTFISPIITIERGTRPANTRPSGRRINDAGDFEITWSAVPNAVAYTVLFKYPSGSDEVGRPYTSITGSRVAAPTTRGVYASSNRFPGRARQVAVNAVNAQGVWNYTPDSQVVSTPW